MAELPIVIRAKDATRRATQQATRGIQRFGDEAQDAAADASRGFRRFGEDVQDLEPGLDRASVGIAAFGAAAVAGLGLLINSTLESTEEIDNLSKRAGISAEQIQIWGRIAEESGAEADDMADAVREMQLRLAEATSLASGPAVDALNLLGLSLEDLNELPVDEQFNSIRDALSQVEDQSQRTFLAEELLGGSTERLTELIGLSADEFRNQAQAAAESGRVFSTSQVEAAEMTRLALRDAKDAIGGVVGELVIALLPAVQALAEFVRTSLVPGIQTVIEFFRENETVAKTLAIALAAIGTTILTVNAGIKAYRAIQLAATAAKKAATVASNLRAAALGREAAAQARLNAVQRGGAAGAAGRAGRIAGGVGRALGPIGLAVGAGVALHSLQGDNPRLEGQGGVSATGPGQFQGVGFIGGPVPQVPVRVDVRLRDDAAEFIEATVEDAQRDGRLVTP